MWMLLDVGFTKRGEEMARHVLLECKWIRAVREGMGLKSV